MIDLLIIGDTVVQVAWWVVAVPLAIFIFAVIAASS